VLRDFQHWTSGALFAPKLNGDAAPALAWIERAISFHNCAASIRDCCFCHGWSVFRAAENFDFIVV
jgi:hypothetical protein